MLGLCLQFSPQVVTRSLEEKKGVRTLWGSLVRTPSFTAPHQPRSMTIRPNGGIRMVTSPSTTHPDAWPLSVKREANATGKNYMAAETFCGQHDQWDGKARRGCF